ncbi:MAG: hypothetical protein JEZ04_15710 [Spirochaetales bacterium]|nr:hypothetical protein [Spirochaetales bacterium]
MVSTQSVGRGGIIRLVRGGTCTICSQIGRKYDDINLIEAGDANAELVYRAIAHYIVKSIGANYAVLKGDIDGIVITGGLAYDKTLIGWVLDFFRFMGTLFIYPGDNEMKALVGGVLISLRKEQKALNYIDEAKKVNA